MLNEKLMTWLDFYHEVEKLMYEASENNKILKAYKILNSNPVHHFEVVASNMSLTDMAVIMAMIKEEVRGMIDELFPQGGHYDATHRLLILTALLKGKNSHPVFCKYAYAAHELREWGVIGEDYILNIDNDLKEKIYGTETAI